MLVLLALSNEHALVSIKIGEKNLLWVMAVLSAGLALSRSMVPDPRDLVDGPERCMRQVAAYTHWYPERWRQALGLHSTAVRDEFQSLFPYRLWIFLQVCFCLGFFFRLISCFFFRTMHECG